jgi:hypothetical protein
MTNYNAKTYDVAESVASSLAHADPTRKRIAVCFSGGGSRALTCACGQLLGLHTLTTENRRAAIQDIRYMSAVSGGSWAAASYSFLPSEISYETFLGDYFPPADLYYGQNVAGGLNVCVMGDKQLGKVPQNFGALLDPNPLKNIIAEFITIATLKRIDFETAAHWLWFYVIGKIVLADFGLYRYQFSILQAQSQTPWLFDEAKFFSLSSAYVQQEVTANPPAPTGFDYLRGGDSGTPEAPFLIINTNIVGATPVQMAPPVQIPVQITPVSGAILGRNPLVANDAVGGGGVQSFAFTSELITTSAGEEGVQVSCNRPYQINDMIACSSVFYAEQLVNPLKTAINTLLAHSDDQLNNHFLSFVTTPTDFVLNQVKQYLGGFQQAMNEMDPDQLLASLVPQYNYWPVDKIAMGAAANRSVQFTDGGTLENTGVAGLIAQVRDGVSAILAFVNSYEKIGISDHGDIQAAQEIASLFGIAYDNSAKKYAPFQADGVNPFTGQRDTMGFNKIFDNGQNQFASVQNGLYQSNQGGSQAAHYRSSLQVVDNQLFGITGGFNVDILWVQNAPINDWLNQIADTELKTKIQSGQTSDDTSEFAGFPYYSTIEKIHQTAAETNALAQMWAWAIVSDQSTLNTTLKAFFNAH